MIPVMEAIQKHQPEAAKTHLAAGRAIYMATRDTPAKSSKSTLMDAGSWWTLTKKV